MSSATSSPSNKSRRSLFLLLAAFALPVILAKLALEQNWLDYGVSNYGSLIERELTLTQLGLENTDFDKHWLILYTLPKQCASHCEKSLESVHNTYVALGKEMPRVTPVALIQHQLSKVQNERIGQSQWHLIDSPSLANNILEKEKVYIVDPLGNVFLMHDIPTDEADLAAFGKQILADMKKLLKYSRVG